jgi:hypothetical protein
VVKKKFTLLFIIFDYIECSDDLLF